MPVAATAVDGDHREGREARRDGPGQTGLDAAGHHPRGVLPLPCNAISGRSGTVWPGGLAIAELVAHTAACRPDERPVDVGGGGRRRRLQRWREAPVAHRHSSSTPAVRSPTARTGQR